MRIHYERHIGRVAINEEMGGSMGRVFSGRRQRWPLVVAGIVATLTFVACANEESPSGDGIADAQRDVEVAIQSFAFEPRRIEVERGMSVTWTNRDAILHTVTSGKGQKQGAPGVSEDKAAKPSGLFDHEMDGEGSTFRFTFEDPGEFDYFCSIHPGMTAVVVVE